MTENPDCRLYLVSPPEIAPDAFVETLNAALSAGEVDCFLLALPEAGDDDLAEAAKTLLPVCHAHDVPLLVRGRADIAAAQGADGCEVGGASLAQARTQLDGDRIIGCCAVSTRHAALEAAEKGADYVAFDFDLEGGPALISWWCGLVEIPAVAVVGASIEVCAEAAASGVEFIALSSLVWDHPAGPAVAVAAAKEAIAAARAT